MSKHHLTTEDAEHLDNLVNGGLMRKVTPDDIAAKFLQHGYARNVVGGLLPTQIGHKIFMEWKKANK